MKESAKNISELLRGVDKIIKTGNLEEATRLIEKILEINPKNIYARAYSERISSLLKERKKKKLLLLPPNLQSSNCIHQNLLHH